MIFIDDDDDEKMHFYVVATTAATTTFTAQKHSIYSDLYNNKKIHRKLRDSLSAAHCLVFFTRIYLSYCLLIQFFFFFCDLIEKIMPTFHRINL